MFWRGRWFGMVNVLALSMAWRCQCFGTVNVLARSIFYNGLCFGAVAQMPASDNPWGTSYIKSNFYTDCTKILTVPKHRPNRYTDNDGPKGHLVSNTNFFQRDTRSAQTLVILFLETGGPAVLVVVCCPEEILCRRTPPRRLGISKRHFTGWIQIVWGWFM